MSTQTIQVQTDSQLFVDNDNSKFLLGFNEFGAATVTASGADVVLTEGMVLARIGSTDKIKPVTLATVDGSEYIVGVAIKDQTVTDGTSATVTFVNKGRIDESKIDVPSGTLASLQGVTGAKKTVRDWLNELGLVLELATELTKVDNS